MYEYLSGELVTCGDDHAVVDVGGVGYFLEIPSSTANGIRGEGRIRLYTVHRVRDDQAFLYGFGTQEERAIFRRICSVSGVGPGIGLAILSSVPIDEFREAVQTGQSKILQKIRGVGKKTADRLVLELKDVLGPSTKLTVPSAPSNPDRVDAIAALVHTGFSPAEAEQSVQSALRELPEAPTSEEIFKAALRLRARV